MLSIMLDIMLIIMIGTAIILLASILMKKTNLDREKTSPFECGFDPFSNSRIPFSLRFYMITIIFLIFDAEIAIILPLPLSNMFIDTTSWMTISMIFVMTLLLGLIHEWNFGSLDWSY